MLKFHLVGFLISLVGAQHNIFSLGNWTGTIWNSSSDLGNGIDDPSCTTGDNNKYCLYRFPNVYIPQGASVMNASFKSPSFSTTNPLCFGCRQYVQVQLTDDAPLLTSSFVSTNISAVGSDTGVGGGFIDIGGLIQQIVSRPGWKFGNSIIVTVRGAYCNFPWCQYYDFGMYPRFNASLVVVYGITSSLQRVAGNDLIYAGRGSWDTPSLSGQLNVAQTTSYLTVGIRNTSVASIWPSAFIDIQLTAQGKLSDISSRSYSCKNAFSTIVYPFSQDHECVVPCLGSVYVLNFDYCWVIGKSKMFGNLSVTHLLITPTQPCFNFATDGTISFPVPKMLDGSLLPMDGRRYASDAGLVNANITSQNLNDRNAFLASFAAQQICMDDSNIWMTVYLGNATNRELVRCKVRMNETVTMPPNTAPDMTVGVVECPPCDATVCTGAKQFSLSMKYVGVELIGHDSVFYPDLPTILSVRGCADNSNPQRTAQCSTEGGTRVTITLQETPGDNPAMVSVGGLPCNFANTYLNDVTCELPESFGLNKLVTVTVREFTSTPLPFVSYAPPTIQEIIGGLGCYQDNTSTANNKVIITNCSRLGSNDEAVTVRGVNFGPLNAGLALLLNARDIAINRSTDFPHREFSFFLPPGLGENLNLTVMVAREQSDYAILSYEPCPIGLDDNCQLCPAGKYGESPGNCERCVPGRFQNLSGQVVCAECPKGTFSYLEASSSCLPCPRTMTTGYRGMIDASACAPCPFPFFVARVEGGDLECRMCPTHSTPTDGAFACQCAAGYYDIHSYGIDASIFKESLLDCEPCPRGADCSQAGNTNDNMIPLAGWWRSSVSKSFYECLKAENCPVSRFTPNNTCAPYRTGILCAACETGYRDTSAGEACAECSDSSVVYAVISVVLIVIAVIIIGIIFAHQRLKQQLRARTRALSTATSTVPSYKNKSLVPSAKIFVGFLQVTTSMSSSFVGLPTGFVDVMNALDFINFDFVPWNSICFSFSFYTRLYISCLYPIVVLLLLSIVVVLPVYFTKQQLWEDVVAFQIRKTRFLDQARTFVLFCTFMLYPQITLQLLQVGICIPMDNESYLMADVSQKCFQSEWESQLAAVIVLFLLVPIGVPLTCGVLLYRARDRLKAPETRSKLGFLYSSYNIDSWWFELFEIAYKVSLISVVRFFSRELQAPIRMGICFVYLVTVLLLQPFLHDSWERLALFCSLEIMLLSMLMHVLPVIGDCRSTYIDTLLSVLLIFLLTVIAVFFCFLVVRGSQWFKNHPTLQSYLIQSTTSPRYEATVQNGASRASELMTAVSDVNDSDDDDDASGNRSGHGTALPPQPDICMPNASERCADSETAL